MKKVLTINTINKALLSAEYAVRGEIAVRAEVLRKQLEAKPGSLPFKQITNCNIGNPQQLKQHPITFFRQVAALVEYTELLNPENEKLTLSLFPKDAVSRAKTIVDACSGNIGAYSHSQGIPQIRNNVAKFIEQRDGYPSNPESIFLTAGASQGVQYLLQTLIAGNKTGVMIPIPQYPLYTATLDLLSGIAVPYYLNEESGWSLSINELQTSINKARRDGVDVRALCIINPGNPTGNCLSMENMREIVEFCKEERLVLMADEVYQTNVYKNDKPFISFKSVVKSMGSPYSDIELVSFHSISKGVIGECGRRGGYFELSGFDPDVQEQIYKLASISLCPTVQGQIMVDLMVNPPKPGEESFELYEKECKEIYNSLKRRAHKLQRAFNEMEGYSCQEAEGAMYLFPTVNLPQKAVAEAERNGMKPDSFYCLELLNATGVCLVPGSGFGQKPGTWHFRSTFLPPEDQFDDFIRLIKSFNQYFMDKYMKRAPDNPVFSQE